MSISEVSGEEARPSAICAICQQQVADVDQERHLAEEHPTPEEGFIFFHDGRCFRTPHPSLLVSQILSIVAAPVIYQFYEERDGEMIPFSHSNSVDLTHKPHFYSVPPATY